MFAEFTTRHGNKICIMLDKITAFYETKNLHPNNTFICAGGDGCDGEESGWHVKETIDQVKTILRNAQPRLDIQT